MLKRQGSVGWNCRVGQSPRVLGNGTLGKRTPTSHAHQCKATAVEGSVRQQVNDRVDYLLTVGGPHRLEGADCRAEIREGGGGLIPLLIVTGQLYGGGVRDLRNRSRRQPEGKGAKGKRSQDWSWLNDLLWMCSHSADGRWVDGTCEYQRCRGGGPSAQGSECKRGLLIQHAMQTQKHVWVDLLSV